MTTIYHLYEVQRKSPTTGVWASVESYAALREAQKTMDWYKSRESKRLFRVVEKIERVVE